MEEGNCFSCDLSPLFTPGDAFFFVPVAHMSRSIPNHASIMPPRREEYRV